MYFIKGEQIKLIDHIENWWHKKTYSPSTTISCRCKIPSYVLQKATKHNAIHGISPSKRRPFAKQEKRTQGKERRIYSTYILTNKNIFHVFLLHLSAYGAKHWTSTAYTTTSDWHFILHLSAIHQIHRHNQQQMKDKRKKCQPCFTV